ncbi:hypothetical protein ACPPVQ_19315 [Diaminobutyricibacter sp. McL0618]|uniref:hypothetical protein n=1 Tax=Leifsonia sp. McL0618 TaxID=3415677 RepID=UPI003CF5FCE9
MPTTITKSRRLALGAAVVGVALLLAGCSAAAAPAAPAATQARQFGGQGGAQGAGGGQGAGGFGGIFGQIAAVTGTTLQVQSQSAQTAVTVASTTTVLQTSKGSIADVTVGRCVVASSFGGTTAGSTPAPSTGGAVTSVAITPAVNGACTGGFRGGAGAGTRPSARPGATARPSAPRNRAFTPPVSGAVTAVSGSSITVSVKDASGATSSKTVQTGPSTAFTITAKATSAALTVGKCAAVRGPADSAGTVKATSVTVSDPGANGCTTPFGRGGGLGGTPSSPGASGGNA